MAHLCPLAFFPSRREWIFYCGRSLQIEQKESLARQIYHTGICGFIICAAVTFPEIIKTTGDVIETRIFPNHCIVDLFDLFDDAQVESVKSNYSNVKKKMNGGQHQKGRSLDTRCSNAEKKIKQMEKGERELLSPGDWREFPRNSRTLFSPANGR